MGVVIVPRDVKIAPRAWWVSVLLLFRPGYWITIGKTIYHPRDVDNPFEYPTTLRHELVHVNQWRKWGVWLWASYLLLPLPVFFAWGRWRWEREAYLATLSVLQDASPEVQKLAAKLAAQRIWRGYLWPWPRAWMERWFLAQLKGDRDDVDWSVG